MQIQLEKEFLLTGQKYFNWKVTLIFNPNIEYLLYKLNRLGCKSKCIKQAFKTMQNKNVGFTYTNTLKQESIIQISKWTNKSQLINTISHESRHLQQHISNYYNINENSEYVCYLLAYIIQKIYEICVDNNLL